MILKNSGTGWNTIPDPNINDGIKKERSSRMEKILQQTRCENIPHRLIFKVGVPFEALIHLVKEEQVDIVTMGAKARTNLVGVLLGSTAEKMFRLCPVPLLSIRRRQFESFRQQQRQKRLDEYNVSRNQAANDSLRGACSK